MMILDVIIQIQNLNRCHFSAASKQAELERLLTHVEGNRYYRVSGLLLGIGKAVQLQLLNMMTTTLK